MRVTGNMISGWPPRETRTTPVEARCATRAAARGFIR